MAEKNGHLPQHGEPPTWCMRCGEFYFDLPCRAVGDAAPFDTRDPEKALRLGREVGILPPEVSHG